MLEVLDKSLNAKDTFFLNKILGLGVDVENNVAYIKTNRDIISRKIGVNIKTVTRRLSHLGDIGFINVEKKLGKNGGYVIKLNPDKFNFPNDDSVLKNPTTSFIKLVDKLYTKKNRNKGVRRTRSEMAIIRDEQSRMSELQRKENSILINEYSSKPIDWNFFSKTSNPDRNLRIWVISRAYDAYVRAYENKYERSYKQKEHIGSFYYGKGKKSHADYYHSLRDGFIGSRNYNSFNKLLEFSDELNENPIVLMGKVFERYAFNHYSYQHPARIPVPNQIVDVKGISVIRSSLKNQKETNRYRMGASTDFIGSAELISINRMYLDIDSESYDYSKELSGSSELISLSHYYSQLMFNASSILDKHEIKVLHYYMNEQLRLILGRTGISHVSSEIATVYFEELKPFIDNAIENHTLNELFRELSRLMGNYSDNYTGNSSYMMASAYRANINGNNIARRVRAVLLQRNDSYYTIHDVMEVVSKVGTLLPLTKIGMLDRNVVFNQY